jgi:glycosyltransferase involved in cell wall biosynthesis
MTALFFHPEGFSTKGPKLMGRHAAGESFLRGYFAHARADDLWIEVELAEHGETFAAAARAAGRAGKVHVVDRTATGALAAPGGVHLPGPGLGDHAWRRARHGHGAWSITGLTHTTASAGAMSSIVDFLTAPVQPWDALICTSQAVKANVEAMLQAQAELLRARLGATRFPLPRLPVIPLGVHCDDFAIAPAARAAARARLGAGPQTRVVLFAGRLSFHAKAHPLAMYQALEAAARSLGGRGEAMLVECGWHATPGIAKAFADAARLACPSLRCVTLDGRDPAARARAWAAADIFCSLSDNIQETFGLTPIEAMAAGLPAVVSDWDGYKDTVRDGIDGIRVPTLMPGPGLGEDLAQRHALGFDDYDVYCGRNSNLVAVDIRAASEALSALFAAPERARALGESGRRRARETFDWSVLIPRYEALWDELAAIRRAGGDSLPRLAHPWPARMDPFAAFAAYPSATLTPDMRFELVDPDPPAARARLDAYARLWMVSFDQLVPPRPSEIETILERLGDGPRRARDLAAGTDPGRSPHVFRGLVWLAKLGLIRPLA